MSRSVKQLEQAIGEAIDEARELPEWVNSELGVNQSIRDFHDRSNKLAFLLRQEASDWLKSCRSVDAVKPRSDFGSTRYRFATVIMVATCASLLAIALIPVNISQYLTGEPDRAVSKGDADQLGSVSTGGHIQGAADLVNNSSTHELVAVDTPSERAQTLPSSIEDPQLIFLAFESTLNAIELINSTLADRVMGDPLDRVVHQHAGSKADAENLAVDLEATDSTTEKSLELLRELKRTSDFLAQSFPRRTLRSSVDSGF